MIFTENLDLSKYCFDEQRRGLFITLTSFGYLDYTLNLIESVRRLGLSNYLLVFVLDVEGYNALLSKAGGTGVRVIYYPNRHNLSQIQRYLLDQWHFISSYKIEIVHRLLRLGYDVLFTDSDIVFLSDPRAFLQDHLPRSDILIQDDSPNLHLSDSPATTYLCMGFFYVKSNEKTVEAFDARHMRFSIWWASLLRKLLSRKRIRISDQIHFNRFIKHRLNVSILPRSLFPNGYYYYNRRELASDCYLIHFNYLVGDEKREKMIQDGYYFLQAE